MNSLILESEWVNNTGKSSLGLFLVLILKGTKTISLQCMGCWSTTRLPSSTSSGLPYTPLIPIYTPGWGEAIWAWSVLPKNTTQLPSQVLRPLNPGSSTLIIKQTRLPHSYRVLWEKIVPALPPPSANWGLGAYFRWLFYLEASKWKQY